MIPTDFIMDAIRRIYANDRLFSYSSMLRTCSVVEGLMKSIGMTEVRTYQFPADGKIAYGGWVMPLAWEPHSSLLEVVLPDGTKKKICSYEETPCSLMLYSKSGDVTAEMVIAGSGEDVKGKIVLETDHFISAAEVRRYYRQGALSVIAGWIPSPYIDTPGFEHLRDSCQWQNYTISFWPTEESQFGFSISPNQTKYLKTLLKQNGSVTLHAKVNAEMKEGTIPLVTGLYPGETDEEIVITGHLFEEGADDNASGCATAMGIVKELFDSGKKLKRGIRLMFTHEIKSLQAYVNNEKEIPRFVAGLDMDMVGVSLDGATNIGDSYPVFPSYAPAFLKYLIEHYGNKAAVRGYNSMDTQFSDNFFRVPMSYMDLMTVPDYHKNTDTPETISKEVLERNYQIARHYVTFLADAGLDEAQQLAAFVYDFLHFRIDAIKACDTKKVVTGFPTPAFAAKEARERLLSILPLVEKENRKEFETFLESVFQKTDALCRFEDPQKRPVLSDEERRKLEKIVPLKKFRGFLSFEKYMMRADDFPKVSKLLTGWCSTPWIENMVMWADGKRNAAEIWDLLTESGKTVEADLMADMLEFLSQQGYVENLGE